VVQSFSKIYDSKYYWTPAKVLGILDFIHIALEVNCRRRIHKLMEWKK
jgi:hypothetical protein